MNEGDNTERVYYDLQRMESINEGKRQGGPLNWD